MDLDEELRSLGGGDAKLEQAKLFAFIRKRSPDDHETVWSGGSSVSLRDINLPRDYPVAESLTHYPVAGSVISNADFCWSGAGNDMIEDVSNSINDGFNVCLLCVGAIGGDKTASVFGGPQGSEEHLVGRILQSIYHYADIDPSHGTTRIALSVWCLEGGDIVDLLVPTASAEPLSFTNIHCPTLQAAASVISQARSRVSCLSAAQFFLRVSVHSADRLAVLYVVDTADSCSTSSAYYKSLPESDKISCRNRAVDMNTLFKVLAEMQEASLRAARRDEDMRHQQQVKLTSARSSKLTTLLAPILQGNMRIVVAAFIKDGEAHYAETRTILTHLKGLADITSACYRLQGIEWNKLKALKPEQYLAPVEQYHPVEQRGLPSPAHSVGTDYGDINLETLASGSFDQRRSPQQRRFFASSPAPQAVPRFVSEDLRDRLTLPELKALAAVRSPTDQPSTATVARKAMLGQGDVSQIMDEFHQLVGQLQQQEKLPVHNHHHSQSNERFQPMRQNQRISSNPHTETKETDSHLGSDTFRSILERYRPTQSVETTMQTYEAMFSQNMDKSKDRSRSPPSRSAETHIADDDSYSQHYQRSIGRGRYASQEDDQGMGMGIGAHTAIPVHTFDHHEADHPPDPPKDDGRFEATRRRFLAQLSANMAPEEDDESVSSSDLPSRNQSDDSLSPARVHSPVMSPRSSPVNRSRSPPRSMPNSPVRARSPVMPTILPPVFPMTFPSGGRFDDLTDASIPTNISDLQTALTEIEQFRRRQLSLLETIRSEAAQRENLTARYQALQEDMLELRTQSEVEVDSLRYEQRQLHNKLRMAYEGQSLEDLFVSLEHDISRLTQENQQLREHNLQLESKALDRSLQNITAGSYEDQASQYHNNLQRLADRLKKSGQDREALKSAYERMRSKERHFVLQEKLYKDSSRRLKLTFHELQKCKKALEQEKLQHLEMSRQFQALQVYSQELKSTNESLDGENKQLNLEAGAVRQRMNDLEQEHQRLLKMRKIADKHISPPKERQPFKASFRSRPDVAESVNNRMDQRAAASGGGRYKRGYEAIHSSPPNTLPGARHDMPPSNYSVNDIHQSDSNAPRGASDIEQILSTLQDTMVHTNPALLPLMRRLEQEIHGERMRSLDQRSQLLSKINVVNRTGRR